MKLNFKIHEDCLSYWSSLRAANAIPAREDFDMLQVADHAPYIGAALLLGQRSRLVCALMGTGLVNDLGTDLTGQDLFDVPEFETMQGAINRVIETKTPVLHEEHPLWAPNDYEIFSVLILPFADKAGEVNFLIGATQFLRRVARTG